MPIKPASSGYVSRVIAAASLCVLAAFPAPAARRQDGLLTAATGSVVGRPSSTFAAADSCTSAADCDDGNACTTDSCDSLNSCAHAPVNGGTTTCGLGVCERTVTACVDGLPQACTPGTPYLVVDDTCNNSDDDCDGVVDDDYESAPLVCGAGVCRRTGMTVCEAGHEVDSCIPGAPLSDTDLTCDGLDDDCDGIVDDDIVRADTTCGIGICQAYGNRSCVNGEWVDTCVPNPPILPSDTNCNNIDSDCDGQIDEDYVPTPIACGLGVCRRTGFAICQAGHIVDDCTPGPPLSATDETCDGVDDDCDGIVDDDNLRVDTTCGVGICQAYGNRSCVNGVLVDTCVPNPPILPSDTNCNNIDSDCDGQIDEDYVAPPITCGLGVCQRTGFAICQAGHIVDDCTPGLPLSATDETCDGVDDDCDGIVDDDNLRVDTTCGVGICQAYGNRSCVNGVLIDTCVPNPPILPSDTNCNNIDSDCDGQIDEDYVAPPITCGTGACRRSGFAICQAGHVIDDCTPGEPLAATDVTCDGIDDDCDGAVDDDIVRTDTTCGVGICQAYGNLSCVNGQWVDTCVPRPPILPSDTNCNNIDSDCDGQIDEDYVAPPITCGVGACRRSGFAICQAGQVIDDCTPGQPLSATDVTCDGVDDDCDGIVDDDVVTVDTTCGVGICQAYGHRTCVDGVLVDSCVPNPPILPSDTNCNNIDSDCDGQIDEDYVAPPITCGVGACRRSGFAICQAGQVIDDCTPGQPLSATDVTCDGIDDDCDGIVDDDVVTVDTTCGVGICQAYGHRTCENGVLVDSCVPNPPILPSDTNCNNIDSDCDGQIDEDYVAPPITCGTGACRRSGFAICQEGHIVDDCTPGQPLSATDVTCDGVDDDCDGAVDDDIVRTDTTCGIGICQAYGNLSCVDGQWVDTCVPRPPILPSDTNCNNIDSDCDGQIDEDYVPVPIACGTGACRRTGFAVCQTGHIVDDCTPGLPTPETCNGIDDDCDGIFDNGGAALCNDGNTCNGIESCGGEQGCRPGYPTTAQATFSIPDDVVGASGQAVSVPIQAQPVSGSLLELTVGYDPAVLQATGVAKTTITSNATLSADLDTPGVVHLTITSPTPLGGAGPVALMGFQVLGAAGSGAVLQLNQADVDGGAVSTCLDSGRVDVCASVPPDVQGVTISGANSTTIAWVASAPGTVYDVASGLLSMLDTEHSAIDAACLVNRVAGSSAVDPRANPSPGSAYYYIVRAREACGAGSYGSESSGEPRSPTASCP